MSDPILRRRLCCFYPFLHIVHRPSPRLHWVGANAIPEQWLQFGLWFRSCRYSFMFKPLILLATLITPTFTYFYVWQPWLLLPNTPWFVTSPRPGYTSRPNRAIGGRGLAPHKTYSLVGCPAIVKVCCQQSCQVKYSWRCIINKSVKNDHPQPQQLLFEIFAIVKVCCQQSCPVKYSWRCITVKSVKTVIRNHNNCCLRFFAIAKFCCQQSYLIKYSWRCIINKSVKNRHPQSQQLLLEIFGNNK